MSDLFSGREAASTERLLTGTWWFVTNASPGVDPREGGVLICIFVKDNNIQTPKTNFTLTIPGPFETVGWSAILDVLFTEFIGRYPAEAKGR